jgi:hypothetical protein
VAVVLTFGQLAFDLKSLVFNPTLHPSEKFQLTGELDTAAAAADEKRDLLSHRWVWPCDPQYPLENCGHGRCIVQYADSRFGANVTGVCRCDHGYGSSGTIAPCHYDRKSKVTLFCLSFFLGSWGADWFYMSRGKAAYHAAGAIKLITLGGLGIWSTIDWIRVLADNWVDGFGFQPGHDGHFA